jgi:hypothetical protein
VDDRERVFGLVGRRVEVGIRGENGGKGAAHLVAMLEEVRDDGVVLLQINELGPGPILFCPWDSLRQYSEWVPWLGPPNVRPVPGGAPQEYYDLYEWREALAEEVAPEPPEQRRHASARYLDRVVPIAQRQSVGDVVVALISLELFGEGIGVLRYRISHERGMLGGTYGVPESEFVIQDESGRVLPWSPQGYGASDTEADGEVEVSGLPASGELEVEVTRLASLVFDEKAGEEVEEDAYDGPWTFRFSI